MVKILIALILLVVGCSHKIVVKNCDTIGIDSKGNPIQECEEV
jgi:hypothetical protein